LAVAEQARGLLTTVYDTKLDKDRSDAWLRRTEIDALSTLGA